MDITETTTEGLQGISPRKEIDEAIEKQKQADPAKTLVASAELKKPAEPAVKPSVKEIRALLAGLER